MRYSEKEITLILERLQYCEQSPTGLIWKTKIPKTKQNAGDIAGHIESNGYARLTINGKRYQATHCILILFGQVIPHNTEVDHIDGNSFNNSVENLRVVDHEINMKNKKKSCKNRSGFTGITIHKETNRVLAYYSSGGKQYTKYFGIGKYGLEEAIKKAKNWRLEMIEKLTEGYTKRHIFQ